MRKLHALTQALLLVAACIGSFAHALAVEKSAVKNAQVKVAKIAPRAEDVATMDGIIKAYYAVVNVPKGEPRQWSRDRTLYIPDIRFVAIEPDHQKKTLVPQIMTHQQYVDNTDEFFAKNGFFENEIHRVTERFGNIAHVFSTYESRRLPDGPVIQRGINSIELFWDGKRWWIASAIWDNERPDNPIPAEYLPATH